MRPALIDDSSDDAPLLRTEESHDFDLQRLCDRNDHAITVIGRINARGSLTQRTAVVQCGREAAAVGVGRDIGGRGVQ